MVKEADDDGSGDIDFGEFLNLMVKSSKEQEQLPDYGKLFEPFDRYSDGKVVAAELNAVIASLEREGDTEVMQVINDYTDADGKLNY